MDNLILIRQSCQPQLKTKPAIDAWNLPAWLWDAWSRPLSTGAAAVPIGEKISAMACLTDIQISPGELELVRQIGDNTGCMHLKGASPRHTTSECDERPMRPELIKIAKRCGHALDW